MSLTPNNEDRAYARGLQHGYASATRMQWHKYPGSCPPDIPGSSGGNRCLCWIETGDGMAYIGLRLYRVDSDGDGHCWFSGSQPESGRVTHWMPLPEPPWLVGAADQQGVAPK